MSRKITVILVTGIVLLIGVGLYYQNNPIIMDTHTEEIQQHNDDLAPHEISPGEVANKVRSNEDIVLLDVRTPEEYEEVHLDGALLLPVQELSQQTLTSIGLGEDMKDKEIILYCRSGARSQTAYNVMTSLGYTNIKSIAGGIIHWQEDNYPFTASGVYTGPTVATDNTNSAISESGPKIQLDRTLHDFGVVPQFGGTVETTFTITNTGIETLEVGTITTSCSCTSAEISDATIEPGEEAILTVIFDPDFHEEPGGAFKRTVFIPTNDPDAPEAEAAIAVDITEGE